MSRRGLLRVKYDLPACLPQSVTDIHSAVDVLSCSTEQWTGPKQASAEGLQCFVFRQPYSAKKVKRQKDPAARCDPGCQRSATAPINYRWRNPTNSPDFWIYERLLDICTPGTSMTTSDTPLTSLEAAPKAAGSPCCTFKQRLLHWICVCM